MKFKIVKTKTKKDEEWFEVYVNYDKDWYAIGGGENQMKDCTKVIKWYADTYHAGCECIWSPLKNMKGKLL